MADSQKSESVLDTFSPASKYEAILLERCGAGLTEDKTNYVFKVLDEIVPHLGVFRQLMTTIRDHMFDSVYSEQYTGSQSGAGTGAGRFIQRVPYFTLVRRIHTEQDEQKEKLEEQLDTVKSKLFEKQKQYEEAADDIARLQQEADSVKEITEQLEEQLEQSKGDNDNLEADLAAERDNLAQLDNQLNGDIIDLKEELGDLHAENTFLRNYKQGYDDLQSAFYEQASAMDIPPKKKKKAVIASKRAHLVSSIESAIKLEDQILNVQNSTIEEYDKFLEDHKAELQEKVAETADTDTYREQDVEIDQADQMLQVTQNRFQQSIQDIHVELELLRQHRVQLQEQLQIVEENKPSAKKKKRNRQESRPATRESSLSAGLVVDEDDDHSANDPFIPQERVFSKYSAMMYTSDNNGKSFNEFKDAKFCPSCGEKTALCPHKILRQDHVFPLPANTTHLKVARPRVKINVDMMDNLFRPLTSTTDMNGSYSPDGKHYSRVSMAGVGSPLEEGEEMPADSLHNTDMATAEPTQFTQTVQRLWEDYKLRTDLERAVPRSLSLARTLSLIEEFCSGLVLIDATHSTSEQPQHILDCLYQFFHDRYLKPEVAFLGAHDLVTSLMDFSSNNKTVWLYTQVLIGNLDGATFRYLLQLGDFILEVDWMEVSDFSSFAAIVYPFLTEDDMEAIQMGYTSFSENKISSSLVLDYIVYLILKGREPRFQEMENKLLNVPGKDAAVLTEQEFVEASDQCLSVPDDKLRRWLYKQSLIYTCSKDCRTNSLPLPRLAQIISYLHVADISTRVMSGIRDQITLERSQVSSHGNRPGAPGCHLVEPAYTILSMAEVKNLATNVSRRGQCRRTRMMRLDTV